jgi:multidrug efflux pump subunit AcrB
VKRFIKYFIDHSVVTNWLMLVIIVMGTFGLINLKKRIWPRIEFDYISINISWPGASAREVEEGIVLKLESRLKGLEGIEQITSTAGDNYAYFGLETDARTNKLKMMEKIRSTLNDVDLPDKASAPRVQQESLWNGVMLLFLYGTEDLSVLESIASEFRDNLLQTGEVTQINIWGFPREQIIIEVLPASLERFGLTLDDLSRAIQATSLNLSAGSILTDTEEIRIRTYNKKEDIPALEKIPIYSSPNGRTVTLGDLADIRRGRAENALYTRANGRNAVGLQIMYGNNEDVVEISKITDEKIAEFQDRYEGLVTFKPYIRDVDELNARLGTLTTNGLIALLLVVLILGFFLNLRFSFWVALGIPLSFAGLFFLEWMTNITINEMSLFGMIMVIGILVDDGIVIGESIYYHWKHLGKDRIRAAIDGTLDVIQPVAVSIATTIVAFTPYFFFYGEMGKYTAQIGKVVIFSLAFSLVEAIILLPAHLAHSKAMTDEAREGKGLREKLNNFQDYIIHRIYKPMLEVSLRHRGAVIAILLAVIIFLAGAFGGNHIRMIFFPEIEAPYVYAAVNFPAGTAATIVNKTRNELERQALEFGKNYAVPEKGYDNGIVDYLSWGGSSGITLYFILIPNEDRDYTVNEFSRALSRSLAPFPEAESIRIGEDSMFGGDPVSIRFLGKDNDQLARAGELFKAELLKIDGVKDIRDDTPLGNKEFIIMLKPEGEALGLTVAGVAGQVHRGFSGIDVMTIQEGYNEVPVVLRYPLTERDSLSRVENLLIKTPGGSLVPFNKVADFNLRRSPLRIRRQDGYRSIRVSAAIDTSVNDVNIVTKAVNNDILPWVLAQVEGVSISQSGQAEEVSKMINSMVFSMATALIVMFTLLMFQMKSYGESLLVLSFIPLGIIGAVLGHGLLGIPVSFISILGGIALGGIIVNDSVVFIDCYNKKIRNDGMDPQKAVLEAALQRFRPIVMTTITTAAGLAPLIFQKSVGGQLLIPIAVSIAFGLIFGTFLTLMVLPSVLSFMAQWKTGREGVRKRRLEPVVVKKSPNKKVALIEIDRDPSLGENGKSNGSGKRKKQKKSRPPGPQKSGVRRF